MKRNRSYWPVELGPAFEDVLLRPTTHTCSLVEQCIEIAYVGAVHSLEQCPSYRSLAELCALAHAGESADG